jgi:hypothetical protein
VFFSSYIPPGKAVLGVDVGDALSTRDQLCHPLTRTLCKEGCKVEPVSLNKTTGSMNIGLNLTGNGALLNFRLVDRQTIFVNSYQALTCAKGKKGLANPFIGFNRFLECADRPENGIKRMIGFVHGTFKNGQGITSERLIRFFHQYLNGTIVCQDWYGAWLYLPMRQVIKKNRTNRLMDANHPGQPKYLSRKIHER